MVFFDDEEAEDVYVLDDADPIGYTHIPAYAFPLSTWTVVVEDEDM